MGEDLLDLPPPEADLRLGYGDAPEQFGDLRLPAGAGPHPVVVAIHGGYWRARYGLDYLGHLCASLTALGLATWNLEYRRIGQPGGGWPGTFLDVATGHDRLRQLASAYQLDLRRVVTIGHSAGGHLALWLAARHRLPRTDPICDPDPLLPRAAVSLAGVVDLRRAWELRLSDNVVEAFLGGRPDQVPERYASASPIELLPLGRRQLLVHGTDDSSVPFELSRRYLVAAQAHGDPISLIPLPGVGHFELVDPGSREWAVVQQVVLEALG